MGTKKRLNSYGERDSGFGGSESATLLFEPDWVCGCGCLTCKCGVCEGESAKNTEDREDVSNIELEDPVQSLLDAATVGNLSKVRKLLSSGIDANARSTGGQPVLTTVLVSPSVRRRPRRLPELTAALVAAGADPGRTEPLRGMTALHAAARLAAGYGPPAGSACGQTNIASRCVAFRCASLRLLRLLTDNADVSLVNSQDHHNRTPLHVLAAHGCLSAQPYEILSSRGADPTIQNYRNETPLLELLDRPGCGCSVPSGVEAVRLLADPSKTGRNGVKAIQMASRYAESPLHVAARRGSEVAVGILLEAGADPSMVDLRGDTPLHVAASRGHTRVVQMLLATRSSVKAMNEDGSTPLHLAVESGFVQVVEVLLKSPDCDASIPSSTGLTAIELAEQAFRHNSQPHILTLLQGHLDTSMGEALNTCLIDSVSTEDTSKFQGLNEIDQQEISEKVEYCEEQFLSGENIKCASPFALKSRFVDQLLRRSVLTTSDRLLCQIPPEGSEKLLRSHSKDLDFLLKKLCLSERVSQ